MTAAAAQRTRTFIRPGVQRQIGEHFRVLDVVWHAEVDEVAIGFLNAAEVEQLASFIDVLGAEFRARRALFRRFAAIESHDAVSLCYGLCYGRLRSNGRVRVLYKYVCDRVCVIGALLH